MSPKQHPNLWRCDLDWCMCKAKLSPCWSPPFWNLPSCPSSSRTCTTMPSTSGTLKKSGTYQPLPSPLIMMKISSPLSRKLEMKVSSTFLPWPLVCGIGYWLRTWSPTKHMETPMTTFPAELRETIPQWTGKEPGAWLLHQACPQNTLLSSGECSTICFPARTGSSGWDCLTLPLTFVLTAIRMKLATFTTVFYSAASMMGLVSIWW